MNDHYSMLNRLGINIHEEEFRSEVKCATFRLYEALDRVSGSSVQISYPLVERHVLDYLTKAIGVSAGAQFRSFFGDSCRVEKEDVSRLLDVIPIAAMKNWEKVLAEVADTDGISS